MRRIKWILLLKPITGVGWKGYPNTAVIKAHRLLNTGMTDVGDEKGYSGGTEAGNTSIGEWMLDRKINWPGRSEVDSAAAMAARPCSF